jgi:hypothetical protein
MEVALDYKNLINSVMLTNILSVLSYLIFINLQLFKQHNRRFFVAGLTRLSSDYFEASTLKTHETRFTDGVTKAPVDAEDPFYQEKQVGGQCSVHSMHGFSGGRIVDITELFKFNNKMQKEVFTRKKFIGEGESDTDALKAFGVYLETVEDLDKCGVSHSVVKSFIESNKKIFDLPDDSSMNIVEGPYEDPLILKEMETIQTNTNLHRIILGIGGKHYIAIRKDKAKKWRVLDSQDRAHDESATDKTKKIQPGFDGLKGAVGHVVKTYKSTACILISPTKEKSTTS